MDNTNYWAKNYDWIQKKHGDAASILYGKMLRYAENFDKDQDGYFWRRSENIIEDTGWGNKKLVKTIQILEDIGLLSVIRSGGGGTSRYRVEDGVKTTPRRCQNDTKDGVKTTPHI